MTQPLIYLIKRACSRVQDSRNCDIYKTNAEKKNTWRLPLRHCHTRQFLLQLATQQMTRALRDKLQNSCYTKHTDLATLRKVDAHSTFPAIPNTIAKRGVTRAISCTTCLANAVALPSCRKTLLRVTTPLVHSPLPSLVRFHAFRFLR